MYTVELDSLTRLTEGPEALPSDAMSGNPFRSVPYDDAIREADFGDVHQALSEISEDGVLDWSRFDITLFGRFMPSMAVLHRVLRADGQEDFQYGFVGESICTIAKRNLRGVRLRDVLFGPSCDPILEEYGRTLTGGQPRASMGNVSISDMHWVRYLRFLYLARTATGLDRVLLFMLFAPAPRKSEE